MILFEEGKTEGQQSDAHDFMTILTLAYPDHPWAVKVEPGYIFVRYLDPLWEKLFKGPVGFFIREKELYSASDTKKQVLMAGGQLLEMMNLRRGVSNGDEPVKIEGVPKTYHRKEVTVID